MRWWLLISICLLLLLLCDSISFNRTFKLKRQKKPSRKFKNGTSIFRKALKKVMNISSVPTLPPIPTLKPRKVIVKNNNEEYNPCKVVDLCSNGGICKTKSNEYYCECKPEYYGKTCEFYADPSYCDNQKCQNNGTCYSIDKPIVVQNPKFFDPSHDPTTMMKELTVEVRYQCWCKPGFYGAFCEFSEAMRHCVEESCSGHGIIKSATNNNNFECECHCEENYSGEKCERVSPCRDLECTNQGKCIEQNGEAKCECPSLNAIQFVEAEVTGETCEIIHIDDEKISPEACMPCLGDFQKWIKCLEEKHGINHDELGFLWKSCEKSDSECYSKLEGKDCFNHGNCSAVIDQVPIERFKDKLFLVPKCYCSKNFQGDFCQHSHDQIRDPCEEAKHDFKCNGTCLFSEETGLQCLCDDGMKGPTCEIKDPCMPNPCEDANTICVEIPDETNSPTFSCICGLNQDVDPESLACITPHHEICTTETGESTCKNNGHCYPCALDENEKLSVCTESEAAKGFRCICPPGFMPPFCDQKVDACSFHKCQNEGKCIPKNGTLADYDCECKHDYNGTFCEKAPNICKAEGLAACGEHGICEEDVENERNFTCKCKEGFYGLNCEKEEEWNFFNEIDKHYWWTYPLILSFILFPFGVVVLWLKRRNRLAKEAAEAEAAKNNNDVVESTVQQQQ